MDPDTKNPLDIPEILRMIGHCLPYQSLILPCLRVSKHWYATLFPALWYDIQFLPGPYPRKVPSFQLLEEHAPLVQRMILTTSESHVIELDRRSILLPNLFSLIITAGSPTRESDQASRDRALISFIKRHRLTLRQVTMFGDGTRDILEALADCPNLERIPNQMELKTEKDFEDWISLYERLWSHLRVASFIIRRNPWPLASTNFIEPSAQSRRASTGLNRTRELTIFTAREMYWVQRWVLEQCPELIRLFCHIDAPPPPRRRDPSPPPPPPSPPVLGDLAEMIQSGRSCQRLEELIFPRLQFSNNEFLCLMRVMPRLTKLALSESSFDFNSWATLKTIPRHLITIRLLNLSGCLNVPGSVVQDMLCSMPNLNEFRGGEIWDADILEDPRSWICSDRLESLQLCIKVRSPESSYPMIYSRLGALPRLRSLSIYLPPKGLKRNFFQLKLSLGLDGMLPLGGTLKTFSLDGVKIKVKPAEAQWMLEHWPRVAGVWKAVMLKVLSDKKKSQK